MFGTFSAPDYERPPEMNAAQTEVTSAHRSVRRSSSRSPVNAPVSTRADFLRDSMREASNRISLGASVRNSLL